MEKYHSILFKSKKGELKMYYDNTGDGFQGHKSGARDNIQIMLPVRDYTISVGATLKKYRLKINCVYAKRPKYEEEKKESE